jgi:hypothetical protein
VARLTTSPGATSAVPLRSIDFLSDHDPNVGARPRSRADHIPIEYRRSLGGAEWTLDVIRDQHDARFRCNLALLVGHPKLGTARDRQ